VVHESVEESFVLERVVAAHVHNKTERDQLVAQVGGGGDGRHESRH
jgi:hypothetical protein